MKILVTGSSGLIGSEVCTYFSNRGHKIFGIDNNQRAIFFGPQGDTSWRLKELKTPSFFEHHELDIRDRAKIVALIKKLSPMQLSIQQLNHLMTKQHQFLLMILMLTQLEH